MQKIALLFPGQGSQHVGMGKEICDNFFEARQVFEEANDALGFDLKKLCFEGSMDELTKTENTQPAILTASVAAYRVYMKELGMVPAFAAGHSLGEFSALTCSGSIKFADCVRIVRQRGRFMQEAAALGVGAMAAISRVDKKIIEEECQNMSTPENTVVVSNYNSLDQIVVSGHIKAVQELGERLAAKGAGVIPLKVSAPFHSPLMENAANLLEEELRKYTYGQMEVPVLSNVTALPYKDETVIVDNLKLQIVQPVQWQASMEYLASQGVALAIELGPQKVLKSLMRKSKTGIQAFSYDDQDDVKALKNQLSAHTTSIETDKDLLPVITKCLTIAACTRNRNWDNEEYQKGVIDPYRKIQKLQTELENDNRRPTLKQVEEAIEMLVSVLNTKKVPADEKNQKISSVLDETGCREAFAHLETQVS